MTTIDLSEQSPPIPWRAPAAWAVAVVVYAFVLHWQIGLPLTQTLRQSAVYVLSLAGFSIPARRWARRSLQSAKSATWLFWQHAVIAGVTVSAWLAFNLVWDRWMLGPDFWVIIYANNWLFQLLSGATAYGTVIGLTVTVESWHRERAREQREAALLVQARDAELGAIRSQFQPHFVLNALNSLLALIDRDPAAARTMVVRLADVMKEVFDREDTPLLPLSREVDLVRAYLDVEQVRFGPRLAVTIDVSDSASQTTVPAFLLQPIVENAVKHGIAPSSDPGRIAIAARVTGGNLVLTVSNTGSRAVPELAGGGRGLALTRRRLQTLYGDRQSLTLIREGTIVVARITFPVESS